LRNACHPCTESKELDYRLKKPGFLRKDGASVVLMKFPAAVVPA
jgi:hypothetical protein